MSLDIAHILALSCLTPVLYLPLIGFERIHGVANELIGDDDGEEDDICACEVHQIEVCRCAHAPHAREDYEEGCVADTAQAWRTRHDDGHDEGTHIIVRKPEDIGRVQ